MQWDDRVLKVQNVMDGVRERESEEHAILPSNMGDAMLQQIVQAE